MNNSCTPDRRTVMMIMIISPFDQLGLKASSQIMMMKMMIISLFGQLGL